MSGRVTLVGGGVRSGKSAFALALARRRGVRRAFIATGEGGDDEMRARIARHVAERGDDFTTVEEPIALTEAFAAVSATSDVVVVDSLALWISNLLLRDMTAPAVEAEVDALLALVAERRIETILVSSEVGMGLVAQSALGRAFVDLAGAAHQRAVRAAGEIYFGALGGMIRLRPAPVALLGPDDVA